MPPPRTSVASCNRCSDAFSREVYFGTSTMYSEYYGDAVRETIRALASASIPSVTETIDMLARAADAPLTILEGATLLRLLDLRDCRPQIMLVRESVRARFRKNGGTVREIAPLYLSSYCVDRCKYCNFAEQQKETHRIRLTPKETSREVGRVSRQGSLVLEFTLASDPQFTPDRLIEAFSIAQMAVGCRVGSGVLLCSDHQTTETYVQFAQNGLSGVVQWDETLDQTAYEKWHGGSPRKGLFVDRIDNHDRAMMANLRVATGALFGLADVRFETLMQVLKARYLRQEYGAAPFAFGTARLKPTGVHEKAPTNRASDDAYDLALLVYKLCESDVGRWLQTREEFADNLERMLDGDYFTYRCGSVIPGGHLVHKHEKRERAAQFTVRELSRMKFERGISRAGFKIDYAWMR